MRGAHMPTLEILDQDGRLIAPGLADATVMATMLHPSDETARDGFVAAAIQASLQTAEAPQDTPAEVAKLIFEQGGGPGITQQGLRVFDQGLIAGETLQYVSKLAVHAPEDANIRKAWHLVECSRSNARDGRGRRKASSATSVETAWSSFKAVAHLWAAYVVLSAVDREAENLFDDKRLPKLLGTARAFALFADQHIPPGMGSRSRPVLDLGEIWMIPDSPCIPHGTLEPLALNDDEHRWLADYIHH